MKNEINLAFILAKREQESKYKGSMLGVLWLILNPVLLLTLYTFIFQYVFSAKWQIDGNPTNYTVALFCGLTPFFFITELISKGTDLISGNSNLVKKVVFNKVVLPLSSVMSSTLMLTINITLILISSIIFNDHFSFVSLLLYLYVIPLVIIGFSICTMCSCVGVYFRDFSNLVAFINPVLMFTSPIFFSLETIPESFSSVVLFNPLTYLIEGIRSVVIGDFFDIYNYLTILIVGIICALFSIYFFNKLKEDFSDLV
ncbi:ABC transporter permease [Vibrio splendidus]|jgi:lipopolysaccharide transport system permease protein|uniref:Transport permease protein n=1 Tax=Vibrio splendidus TaxID=29497 RepID=A0ABV4LQI2_VIBSP|nr:ABC transporter permease [Vibrio splendidus]PMH12022.1 hypothetical protein BCU77_05120 [Vibrio splendidus]PMI31408.1 hypothetical protein BCU48_00195 [Vibrio splendidus]PMM38058.1 hypothetical protein BCT55_06625 [Vibrio splendidus]PMO72372.1 hypothetical protein BCT03_16790 [Vibrio splendidus]PTP66471.1 ABC transporter permease [Vibrio splendidus]